MQLTGISATGAAAITGNVKAERLQRLEQSGRAQVFTDGARARRQRRLHPRAAAQLESRGVARQQAGRHHDRRIRGIRATGDGGDDHGPVSEFYLIGARRMRCNLRSNLGERPHLVRFAGASHAWHDLRQIERHHLAVLRLDRSRIVPKPLKARIRLHQGDLLSAAPGERKVGSRCSIDGEQCASATVLRGHVGERRPIRERKAL